MFDEHGEVVKGRSGLPDKRRGPVPCEETIGCPKGHWIDSPDLKPGEEAVIDLYHSAKATGGRTLTEAEANDDFLMVAFARMAEIERSAQQAIDRELQEYQFARVAMMSINR